MSYILDALKRADAQRERYAAPGLLAQPTAALLPAANQHAARPRWLALALPLALLALGLLAAAWQFGAFAPGGQGAAQTAATAPTAQIAPAAPSLPAAPTLPLSAVPAAPVAVSPAPAAAPAPPVQTANAEPPAQVLGAAAPAKEPEKSPPLELAQLPASVRQQLPALTLSGSTYSSNPAHRLLILNGQVLREGDALAAGHVVEQIREKSAVLDYKGTRYLLRY